MIDEPLPLSFDPVSNGEYLPPPKTEREILAEKLIRWVADRNARRTGVSRRAFLTGACGMATTLAAINRVYGAGSGRGVRAILVKPTIANGFGLALICSITCAARLVAAAGTTKIPLWMPVIEPVTVSAAEMDRVPEVFKAAVKLFTPASLVVNV